MIMCSEVLFWLHTAQTVCCFSLSDTQINMTKQAIIFDFHGMTFQNFRLEIINKNRLSTQSLLLQDLKFPAKKACCLLCRKKLHYISGTNFIFEVINMNFWQIWHFDVRDTGWVGLQLRIILKTNLWEDLICERSLN